MSIVHSSTENKFFESIVFIWIWKIPSCWQIVVSDKLIHIKHTFFPFLFQHWKTYISDENKCFLTVSKTMEIKTVLLFVHLVYYLIFYATCIWIWHQWYFYYFVCLLTYIFLELTHQQSFEAIVGAAYQHPVTSLNTSLNYEMKTNVRGSVKGSSWSVKIQLIPLPFLPSALVIKCVEEVMVIGREGILRYGREVDLNCPFDQILEMPLEGFSGIFRQGSPKCPY